MTLAIAPAHPLISMNSSNLRSLIVVTALAGLAGLTLANSEFAAHLPFEALLGVALSLALVRIAFADYARRPKTLAVPAEILRPAPRKTVRVAACVERVAA
jgi:hypothetical protein